MADAAPPPPPSLNELKQLLVDAIHKSTDAHYAALAKTYQMFSNMIILQSSPIDWHVPLPRIENEQSPRCKCAYECNECTKMRARQRAKTCRRGTDAGCACDACLRRAYREKSDEPVGIDAPCQSCERRAATICAHIGEGEIFPHVRCEGCLGVFCAECSENGRCAECL